MAKVNLNDIQQLSIDAVSGLYHCTRVWHAWSAGTMTDHDFIEAQDSESPREITAMIVDLLEKSGIEVVGK